MSLSETHMAWTTPDGRLLQIRPNADDWTLLVNGGDVYTGDPESVEQRLLKYVTVTLRRQSRALTMVEDSEQPTRMRDGRWRVPSASSKATYAVDLNARSCTCRDFRYRRLTCKHILRAKMAAGATDIQRPAV